MLRSLALTRFSQLMQRTEGAPDVVIGLIDGPVVIDHPGLARGRVRSLGTGLLACCHPGAVACRHGTFIAGMLTADRKSGAPAICPGCTLLVLPVFSDRDGAAGATPTELAEAIHQCIDAGAMILNISSALPEPQLRTQIELIQALDRAARSRVITIVAAGNEPTVGSSALTGHPWVIPVVGYDNLGLPMHHSTLGRRIGRQGLGGPGQQITSLAPDGRKLTLDGTSFASPFVTGAAALLWSEFRQSGAAQIRQALLGESPRTSIVPPLLNVELAYQTLERATT